MPLRKHCRLVAKPLWVCKYRENDGQDHDSKVEVLGLAKGLPVSLARLAPEWS